MRFSRFFGNKTRQILEKSEDALYKADGAINKVTYCSYMLGLILVDFLADKQMMDLILLDIGDNLFNLLMTLIISVLLEALPAIFALHYMKEKRSRSDDLVAGVTGGAFIILILTITMLRFATIDVVFADTALAGDMSGTAKYVITAFLAVLPVLTSFLAFGISCAVTPERRHQHAVRKVDAGLVERYRQLEQERMRLRQKIDMRLAEVEDAFYNAAVEKARAKGEKLKNITQLKMAAYLHSPAHLTMIEERGHRNDQNR